MTHPATIRDATTEDAAVISALTNALIERWVAPDCTTEGQRHLRAWASTASHEERLRASHACCVAELDGELVGVAAIRPPRHLYLLFVTDAQQRRGLARRLWEAVLAKSGAREGLGPVTVNASRVSVEAYRRLGFVATGEERFEHGFPSTPMVWRPVS